jgi:hypothetical protein
MLRKTNDMTRLRRTNADPLSYYIYVSDAKLDMLFEQIQQSALKSLSAEVKVDLKLASVTLHRAEDPGPARMAKLRIVKRYIEKHHHIGSIQEPGGEYFQGQMNMRWGRLTGFRAEDALPIVYFRGQQDSRTVILAGSSRHLLGEPPQATADAFSALPDIISAISHHLPDDFTKKFPARVADDVVNRAAMVTIYPEDMPPQELRFLALRLHEGPIDLINVRDRSKDQHSHGILATPLYVAVARPAAEARSGESGSSARATPVPYRSPTTAHWQSLTHNPDSR